MIKLQELLSKNDPINDKLRIHLSKNQITQLVNKNLEDYPLNKPDGLWYGFGREWIDFVYKNELTIKHGNYIYYVKLKDPKRILQIKDLTGMEEFSNKYLQRKLINWKVVSNDYDGIEINPYQGKLYYNSVKYAWYGDWSIASGCVWNTNTIELKLIYPKTKI